jgi:hypothetical protein
MSSDEGEWREESAATLGWLGHRTDVGRGDHGSRTAGSPGSGPPRGLPATLPRTRRQGAARRWCAYWTSNPDWGAKNSPGGFDSHALPPVWNHCIRRVCAFVMGLTIARREHHVTPAHTRRLGRLGGPEGGPRSVERVGQGSFRLISAVSLSAGCSPADASLYDAHLTGWQVNDDRGTLLVRASKSCS